MPTDLLGAGFDHVTLDLAGYRTGSVSPAGDAGDAETGSTDPLDAEYPTGDR